MEAVANRRGVFEAVPQPMMQLIRDFCRERSTPSPSAAAMKGLFDNNPRGWESLRRAYWDKSDEMLQPHELQLINSVAGYGLVPAQWLPIATSACAEPGVPCWERDRRDLAEGSDLVSLRQRYDSEIEEDATGRRYYLCGYTIDNETSEERPLYQEFPTCWD